jgi:hypothetical protein
MIAKLLRFQLLGFALIAMVVLSVLINQMRQPHYVIDVGISATRSLTADMRVPEKMQIGESIRTMRWSFNNSHILLPQTVRNAIVVVHTMTRAEDAPAYISMQSGKRSVAIDPTAGLRTYSLFVKQVSPLVFTCDTNKSSVVASLCVAVDTVNVSWTNVSHIELSAVRWYIGLLAILITLIFTNIPAQRWPLRIMIGLPLAALLIQYGVQLQHFVPHLTIALTAISGILWLVRRIQTPWLNIAMQIFVVSVFIKALGVFAPGYMGSDIFFHLNRFTEVANGTGYMFVTGGDGDRNLRTFPYPTSTYLTLAPWLLPVMQWYQFVPFQHELGSTLPRFIGMFIVLIESSVILVLGWVLARFGWSSRQIGWVGALYLALPAAYIVQWQGSLAQYTAQWYGLAAMVVAVSSSTPFSWLLMFLSMTSHFGTFLTLAVTFSIATLWAPIRRHIWHWWLILGVVAVAYYSQYLSLILTQLQNMAGEATASTLAERWWEYAWHHGLYGHYLGIGVALAVLGLILAPRNRWWYMALSVFLGSALLLIVHVVLDKNTSRYSVALIPVVSAYAGYFVVRLQKTPAARILVYALVSYLLWASLTLWFDGAWLGVKMPLLW